ncbi:two-component sensor histidine kinase, partial [Candidatus Bipolaricaulota bacterium]|nr:two-component sensor histidine kinase [Candidatus Bipolaricaulota bacterium]
RFYRADEARAGDGGAGLGLSIAKALIEAHNGRIWAENAPEGGACFVFSLPLLNA